MLAAGGKADYFRYWAKTRRGDETGAACHLLPFHNLDVAAVGWHLLASHRPLAQQLAARLGLSNDSLRRMLVFGLGLHDIGKFARAFQGLAQPPNVDLVSPLPRLAYAVRHDRLGALLWDARWMGWLRDGTLGLPDVSRDREVRRPLSATLSTLMAPMFGHHGVPVEATGPETARFFGCDEQSDDIEAARAFVADLANLIEPDWPIDTLTDGEFQTTLQSLTWTIAGWAVLSDWLGSNQDYFAYCAQRMSLDQYWEMVALPSAARVLETSGMMDAPRPVSYAGIGEWFGATEITPTPLQRQSEKHPLGRGPGLFILEDVTGSGKTEAACILAQRMLAAGQGEGLYFALPTMATSNAMYARLGDLHRRFFTPESNPSFVLAHGARNLNETFTTALDQPQPADRDYDKNEASASAQCNRWLADSRKKALIAEVGVGTIDQVLLGVLPFRHQSLRLYGLARKVLIVDEVHAYDIYVQTLLERLLEHHARQGGSAILLTATLPRRMRESLVAAWQRGSGVAVSTPMCQEFPLLTQAGGQSLEEKPVATRKSVARRVAVDWVTQEAGAVEAVLDAIAAGQCVAWVRNTVDDAIRAFETIRARHPDPERCLLFHSRFVMADRQRLEAAVIERFGKHSAPEVRRGQVLIATQVFQESLDCDVDDMISDLAPVDLLIQRAGRLQRHERGQRPPPRLRVLAPEWTATPDRDWLRRVLPGTQAVYRDASLCWLTQRVLRETGAIRMPEDARLLIESVYGETAEDSVPEALDDAHWEYEGEQRGKASMANFNGLNLAEGYRFDRAQWQEEQDIGTRLSDEPTRNVVLLRRTDSGALEPWAAESRHAAMLSQLRLRQSQTEKLTELSATDQAAWEALQEQYKALRFAKPWVPEADSGHVYDDELGLVFATTRSE